MLITKLNPQNLDFAESEGSGGGAKKQTEFVLSKQPTFRAGDARKVLAIPSLRSLQILSPRPSEGAKVTLLHFFCKKISLDTLLLRFSQKVTQAELFASAHFVRIFMTPPFLSENG